MQPASSQQAVVSVERQTFSGQNTDTKTVQTERLLAIGSIAPGLHQDGAMQHVAQALGLLMLSKACRRR